MGSRGLLSVTRYSFSHQMIVVEVAKRVAVPAIP